MAYVSAVNRPQLERQLIANSSQAAWIMEGTDAPTVVRVNGYITDAKVLGLKVGDQISYRQVNTASPPVQQAIQNYRVVTMNTNGSCDLSDGVATSLTNTD